MEETTLTEETLTPQMQQARLIAQIAEVFENKEFKIQMFNCRCSDTGEPVSVDAAKAFKEELAKLNQVKNSIQLNLQGFRLG